MNGDMFARQMTGRRIQQSALAGTRSLRIGLHRRRGRPSRYPRHWSCVFTKALHAGGARAQRPRGSGCI